MAGLSGESESDPEPPARSSFIGSACFNAVSYSAFWWRMTVSADELLIWLVVLVLVTVLTIQAL